MDKQDDIANQRPLKAAFDRLADSPKEAHFLFMMAAVGGQDQEAYLAEDNADIFYHGSHILFDEFDLSHALEGDGKLKFGYGVYVTSSYNSAAHYSGANPDATEHYVYTVMGAPKLVDNYIAFKQPVNPKIILRAEEQLGCNIPENAAVDGKEFRKFVAKKLTGKLDLEAEKAASKFLLSIGVDFIEWPYSWKNPDLGMNRAYLDESALVILQVDKVELDDKKKLIEDSPKQIR